MFRQTHSARAIKKTMRYSIRNGNLFEIAKSRLRTLNIGQLFIGVCVIALSAWCAYNVAHIMSKYIVHDTIITLRNDAPNVTDFPGVTICAPSIFTPRKLAQLFPDTFGRKLAEYETWKRESYYTKNTTEPQSTRFRLALMREYETYALQNYSALEILRSLSVRPEEVLADCRFHPIQAQNFRAPIFAAATKRKLKKILKNRIFMPKLCVESRPIFESIYEGRKCFTFYSDMFDAKKADKLRQKNITEIEIDHDHRRPCPDNHFCEDDDDKDDGDERDAKSAEDNLRPIMRGADRQMIYDLNPMIDVRIRSIEQNIWKSYVSTAIWITVHPPSILQNRRDFLFFIINSPDNYEIAFTKKTTYLLQKPYKTQCIEYHEDPLFVSSGIRTRDQCISICINDYLRKHKSNCGNYYSVLTESMFELPALSGQKICEHAKQNYDDYLEARGECENHCPAECVRTIFEITGQVRSLNEDQFCPKWWCPKYEINNADADADDDDANQLFNYHPASGLSGNQSLPGEKIKNPNQRSHCASKRFAPLQRFAKHRTEIKFSNLDKKNKLVKSYLPQSQQEEEEDDQSNTFGSKFCDKPHVKPNYECETRVLIRISPKPFTIVRHQAAITFEGFLGTIGGHIGIWLGLSLYKIIKFTVHVLYNLLSKILRRFCAHKRLARSLARSADNE